MFSDKETRQFMYFLRNLRTFCAISFFDGENLGTYCDKIYAPSAEDSVQMLK